MLLIVDNAPTHPTEELLERGNCHQWKSHEMKCHYRRQFLRELLVEGKDKGVLANKKEINLKDGAHMVAEA